MLWRKQKNLKLDLNESALDSATLLKSSWANFLPLVGQYLREGEHRLVLQKIAENHGLSVDQVVLFNGSWHGLMTIFSFLFHNEDEIIVPVPTFPFYQAFEELGQLKIKKISGLAKDITAQNISREFGDVTKGVYLVNPTNPLGELIAKDEIEEIIKRAQERNIVVVLDEAYADFASVASSGLIDKYNNLIILKSGSKSMGLAGVRLGYVLTNKQFVKKLNISRGPSYTLSSIALLAYRLITDNKRELENYLQENKLVRESLEALLVSRNIAFLKSFTNFVSFYHPESGVLKERLLAEGVLVKTLSDYPDGGDTTAHLVRVSIPSKRDWPQLKEALERCL